MSCVIGIGVDIIEISRFEKMALSDDLGVASRIFTSYELEGAKGQNKAQYLASRFAAKEAVMKALGVGMSQISFKDIEVRKDEMGRPYVVLCGNAEEIFNRLNGKSMLISISHCQTLAQAYANLIGGE